MGPSSGDDTSLPDFVDRSNYRSEAEFKRANQAAFEYMMWLNDPRRRAEMLTGLIRLEVPPPQPGSPAPGMDFRRRGPNYNKKVFSSDDLKGADLAQAYAVLVSFRGCNLEEADLSLSWSYSAVFAGARMSGSRMTQGYFASASFDGADLTRADASEAD